MLVFSRSANNTRIALLALAMLCLVQSVRAAITLTPQRLPGGDGQLGRIDVETSFYRIQFSLQDTGAATSLIYKPLNHELRAEDYYGFRNHMFREGLRLAEPDPATGLTPESKAIAKAQLATYRIVKQSPDELVLEFERPVQTEEEVPAWFRKLTLRRRVFIEDASPAIRIEVEVSSSDAVAHAVVVETYNGLSLGRTDSLVMLPGAQGRVSGIDRATEGGSRTIYAPELAAAWMGGVNSNGLGGAFAYDWADVDGFSADLWKTLGAGYKACIRRMEVPAGQSVAFSYTFMPFTSFGSLDGMVGDLAGGIIVGGHAEFRSDAAADARKPGETVPLKLTLASGHDREVQITWRCVRQEDAQVVLDEKQRASLTAGQTVALASQFTPPDDGLYVLSVTVTDATGAVLPMEKGLEVGKTKLAFTPTLPAAAKRGVRDAGQTLGPERMDAQFRTLDRSLVTPHLPLVKNDAGGPAKVFFLMPADHTLGHVRELAERVDLDYEYFAAGKIAAPVGDLNFRDMADFRRILRGADTQALVTLGIDWDVGLKRELVHEILDRVRGGMGLVVEDRKLDDQPELKNALAEARAIVDLPIPAVAVPMPKVRYFELGKGRVAVVVCNWAELRDAGEAALGQWTRLNVAGQSIAIPDMEWRGFEYSYAYLGQIVRWAAGRHAVLTIVAASLEDHAVLVQVNNRAATCEAVLEVVVRGSRWQELARSSATTVRLTPGESWQRVKLPSPMPGGPVSMEVTLRSTQGQVLAFGSVAAMVPDVATVRIAPSSIYQPAEKPGSVTVAVTGKGSAGELSVQVVDRFGRLVLRQVQSLSLQNGEGKLQLNLGAIRPLAIYHEVRADWTAVASPGTAPRLLAQAVQPIYFLPAKPDYADRFVVAVADAPERSARHLQGMLQTARDLGMTLHTHAYDDRILYASGGTKAANQSQNPASNGRYAVDAKAKQSLDGTRLTMTPPLLPSAESLAAAKLRWQSAARKAFETGAFLVMISDERRMSGDFDRSEQTLAGFRSWLTTRYADITQLNQTWGSHFASFSEVMPVKREEVADSDNKAPWLEFRMFIGQVIGDYYMKQPAEWAAEISPSLSVGELGIYDPSYAWPVDWSRYARYYKDTQRYGAVQGPLEVLFPSFAPQTNHGLWTGYGMRNISDGARLAPWRSLLCGGHYVWYWALQDFGFWNYAVCTADWQATAGYRVLAKEEWPDIQGGIDRLIIASKPLHDGIAVGYSYPSWVADSAELGVSSHRIVQELGFQDRYVDLANVSTDSLRKEGYRILILQNASCISVEQGEAIRQFASEGGTLLIVGRNGWRDLHGAPHAGGSVIDPLLGVETAHAQSIDRLMGVKLGEKSLQLRVGWSGVRVCDARVLAATQPEGAEQLPVLTVRTLGKGNVYWLNSSLAGHDVLHANDDVDPDSPQGKGTASVAKTHWRLFDQIIADANIRPRARVMMDEQPLFGSETFYYQSPSRRTLFVARDVDRHNDQKLTLALAGLAHVYDMREGQYLGHADRFSQTFPSGRMQVYALLDYAVRSLSVSVAAPAVSPGGTVRVSCAIVTDGGIADLHAFKYSVVGPLGQSLQAYSGTILAPEGKAQVELPMALNQIPGRYTVQVMDAVSHTRGEASFGVTP